MNAKYKDESIKYIIIIALFLKKIMLSFSPSSYCRRIYNMFRILKTLFLFLQGEELFLKNQQISETPTCNKGTNSCKHCCRCRHHKCCVVS